MFEIGVENDQVAIWCDLVRMRRYPTSCDFCVDIEQGGAVALSGFRNLVANEVCGSS